MERDDNYNSDIEQHEEEVDDDSVLSDCEGESDTYEC